MAIFWLFNIYTITAKYSRGNLISLDKRINFFVDKIYTVLLSAKKEKIDEILIVGHSIGSILAVPIVAKLVKKCQKNNLNYTKLKLLTLGGNIPLVSIYKKASFYRSYLQEIHTSEKLVWIDYTSTIDGTCFPLIDPITSAGLTRGKGKYPIILSTRFYKLFTKENYKKLRYKWFDVHFWYLMSHDIAGEYDYFKITAGCKPLEETIDYKRKL